MDESVSYSILKPSTIFQHVLTHYAWPKILKLGLMHTGTDLIYALVVPEGTFLLRLYSAHRNQKTISAEIKLLQNLQAAGVSVPTPIPTVSKNFSWQIEAPEGLRTAVVYKFIEGRSPGWRMTADEASAFGQAAAKFHSISDQFNEPWERFTHNKTYFLDQGISDLLERAPTESRQIFEDAIKRIQSILRDFETNTKMDAGICHGDLHKRNFIINNHHQAILIDFGCSGTGWRVYDIATTRWSIQTIVTEQSHRDALYNAFLKGYDCIRTLSDSDLKAVPCFFVIRQLWHMKVLTRRAHLGMGTWEPLTDKWFQRQSTFLNDWLTENL